MSTLSDAYQTPNPDHERKHLEGLATGWTPKAQAEHANYTRMQAEGHTLSPAMRTALGYLEQAKTAHDTLNGK